MRRTTALLLLVTGALAPVTVASGAGAQLPLPLPTSTTTTTTTTTSTTTTTTAPTTTTTEADEETVTTTTTEADDGPATTTSTTEAELLDEDESSLTALDDEEGALSISVPGAATLASAPLGTTEISGSLGTVTVTDDRGGVVGVWAASVATTPFTTGGGTPAETIAPANVRYWSGPATAGRGGTFAPGQVNALAAEALGQSRIAFSTLAAAGRSSATWNPTLIIDVPATAVVGTYTGTVTHSVA